MSQITGMTGGLASTDLDTIEELQALIADATILTAGGVYNCASGDSVGDAVYHTGSDDTVAKASCITADGKYPCIGLIAAKPTATTCRLSHIDDVSGFSGLVPGDIYYLSETEGQITNVLPTQIQQELGQARNTTTLRTFGKLNYINAGG